MAIAAATPRVVYEGDDASTAFAVTDEHSAAIAYASNSHIHVALVVVATREVTPIVEGVDYTLTGSKSSNGLYENGIVTIPLALPVGAMLVIWRESSRDQAVTFGANSSFSGSTTTLMADRDRLIDQELDDKIARALATDVAGLAYDAGSKQIKNVAAPTEGGDAVNKTYADAIILVAEGHADDAADSQAAAAASASASASSAAQSSAAAAASSASASAAATSAQQLAASYVGPSPTILYEHAVLDDIAGSFNGVLAVFSLAIGGAAFTPSSAAQIWLFLGGAYQKPGTDFTVAGTQITFTTPPAAGLDIVMVAMKTVTGVSSVTPTGYMTTLLQTIASAAALRQETGTRSTAIDDVSAGFNGGTTTFALKVATAAFTPRDAYGVFCVYNGVAQIPGDSFTVAGSNLTFTFTPQAGDVCKLWAIST